MCILFFAVLFTNATFADECYSNTTAMNLNALGAFVYTKSNGTTYMMVIPDGDNGAAVYKCRVASGPLVSNCGCKFVYKNELVSDCSSVPKNKQKGVVHWNHFTQYFQWWYQIYTRGNHGFSLSKVDPAVCVAYMGV